MQAAPACILWRTLLTRSLDWVNNVYLKILSCAKMEASSWCLKQERRRQRNCDQRASCRDSWTSSSRQRDTSPSRQAWHRNAAHRYASWHSGDRCWGTLSLAVILTALHVPGQQRHLYLVETAQAASDALFCIYPHSWLCQLHLPWFSIQVLMSKSLKMKNMVHNYTNDWSAVSVQHNWLALISPSRVARHAREDFCTGLPDYARSMHLQNHASSFARPWSDCSCQLCLQ